jgi:predicted small integral membrane protein
MLRPGVFDVLNEPTKRQLQFQKARSFEWFGQTLASLCWIISVFVYESDVGLWSNGDWLQLAAASCWFVSNVAALVSIEPSSAQ